MWLPVVGVGVESLICERVETNEYDRKAVSIMLDDCISKEVVGHVPFNWNKLAAKFMQSPNHCFHVVVTEKGVKQGAGFGLEIPVYYIFYVGSRVTIWLRKALEKLGTSLNIKVDKCVK